MGAIGCLVDYVVVAGNFVASCVEAYPASVGTIVGSSPSFIEEQAA